MGGIGGSQTIFLNGLGPFCLDAWSGARNTNFSCGSAMCHVDMAGGGVESATTRIVTKNGMALGSRTNRMADTKARTMFAGNSEFSGLFFKPI